MIRHRMFFARGLRAVALLAALMAAAPLGAAEWSEQEVSIEVAGGRLYGTLTMPKAGAPVPGALILAEAGQFDRNGNNPGMRNNVLLLLAHGLADKGIASLRTDKRGMGASAAALARRSDLRFPDFAADAGHWVRFLAADKRIARVALIGHGEGGLVATLTARAAPVSRLVVLAGRADPPARQFERKLERVGIMKQPGLADAVRRAIEDLEKGMPVKDVPRQVRGFFHAGAQPYLMSWFKHDPVAELAAAKVPTLVVQGTADVQVPPDDAKRLAAARPGIRLALVDGMNHVLRVAPADRNQNILSYRDASRPLAPTLVPLLADFIAK